jgi:hypothetical protein
LREQSFTAAIIHREGAFRFVGGGRCGRLLQHMIKRDQFLPGRSDGGRPKGVRNKLSTAFLHALAQDFDEHGAAVIRILRVESPAEYARLVASMVPKEVGVEVNTAVDAFAWMTWMREPEIAAALTAKPKAVEHIETSAPKELPAPSTRDEIRPREDTPTEFVERKPPKPRELKTMQDGPARITPPVSEHVTAEYDAPSSEPRRGFDRTIRYGKFGA